MRLTHRPRGAPPVHEGARSTPGSASQGPAACRGRRYERARRAASISSRCSPRCSPRAGLIGLSGSLGHSRSRGSLAARASVSSAVRRANCAATRGAIAWIRGRVESFSQSPSGSASPDAHGSPRSIFSRQGLEADIPVGDVTEHAGNRPVLVHGRGKRLVVKRLDERTHALSLSRVRFDVRPIVTHGPTIQPRRQDARGDGGKNTHRSQSVRQ